MKLLFVHGTDAWYGSDRALYTLVRELASHGAQITVAIADSSSQRGPLSSRLEELGVAPYRVGGSLLDRQSLRSPIRTFRRNAAASIRIAYRARRNREVVVANTALVAHLVLLAQLLRVPSLTIYREINRRPGVARLITRYVYSPLATQIVAVSEAVRAFNVRPRDKAKCLVALDQIAAGPTPRFRAEGKRDLDAIVVGRLNPERAPHLALDAVDECVQCGLDVHLRFVGDGDSPAHSAYVATLKRRAETPSLKGRVEFCGFVTDPTAQLAAADVVLNPRPEEPLGHSVLEAMRLGKAVVAAAAGGPAEVITNGHSGLLVKPGDAQAIADALKRLCDPDLRHRLGTRAKSEYAALRSRAERDQLEIGHRLRELSEAWTR